MNITPTLLEGITFTVHPCVCVKDTYFHTCLLNILFQSQFPKENILLKFLDGFSREYKKAKKYLLVLRGKSKMCLWRLNHNK